ncbi:MAG: NBR1-Ig-like domain-containing protein [Acidobacteriota bacterium]
MNLNLSIKIKASVSGSHSGIDLGADLELGYDPDAHPVLGWVSGKCPACVKLRAVSGEVTGIDHGTRFKLALKYQDEGAEQIDISDWYEQTGPDGAPIPYAYGRRVPEPQDSEAQLVELWAIPGQDPSVRLPECSNTSSGNLEFSDLTLNHECCRPGTSGNDCGETGEYPVSVRFDNLFTGISGYGGANLILKLYPSADALEPRAVSPTIYVSSVFDGTEPVEFPLRAQHGEKAEIQVLQAGLGMRCTVVPQTVANVVAPIEAILTCDTTEDYFCHFADEFCTGDCPNEWRWHGQRPISIVSAEGSWTTSEEELFDVWRFCGVSEEPGPIVYARNNQSSTWSGVIPIQGVARLEDASVTSVRFFLGSSPVQLDNLQINRADSWTCDEYPTVSCNPQSGFIGDLDTRNFPDGTHTLTIVADRGPGSVPGFRQIQLEIDNSGGGSNSATHVANSLPSQMECGQSLPVTVTMRNSGTATWTSDLCYKLGAGGDSDPFLPSNRRWPLPGGADVAENEQVTFSFTLQAPDEAGDYETDWRMISEVACGGDGWFGDVVSKTISVTCSDTDAAQIVSHTLPAAMACSETRPVEVRVRNTGTTTWTSAAGYRLGAVGGSDPLRHNIRVALPDGVAIAPGDEHVFSFDLVADPAMTGDQVTDWRMLQENVQWFGATAASTVAVSCSDDSSLVAQEFPASLDCGETYQATVTLQNTGESIWTPEAGYALVAPDYEPFRPAPPRSFTVGQAVTAPGSHTFNVSLIAPDAPGSYTTLWQMTHPGAGTFGAAVAATIDVACQGAELAVTGPSGPLPDGGSYDFGLLSQGEVAERDITLCNVGTGDLTITPKGAPRFVFGSGYFGTHDPDGLLSPGSCTHIGARFTSDSPGTFPGSISFESSDRSEPFDIGLTATVSPSPEILVRPTGGAEIPDGGSYPFTGATAGTPTSRLFEICNTGSSALSITHPDQLVSGNGFTQIGELPPATLEAGACGSFRVRFYVATAGSYSGAVTIDNSDSDENPYNIALSGTAN